MKEVGVKIKVGATGLEQIDKLSSELNAAGVSTTALDNKAAQLAAELKKLGEQQALIDAFKRQKQAVDDAATAMQAAKAKAGELGREIGATEAPTKKQEAAFAKARAAAREASDAYTAQRLALQTLRTGMAAAGVSTEGLAEAQRRVKAELADAQANMRATADWAQRLATAERAAATQATALAGASGDSAVALRQTAAAAREAVNPLEGVGNTLRSVAAVGVAGILGSETAQMLRSVAETADAYANLQARIKLVTGEGEAFNSAMEGIAAIALRTNSNLENTGTLFSRIADAGKQIGVGQEQSLAITESINQAIQLSGASAASSDAAITQLIQGLQSGVVRGEEFNSIMEQAPRLATALADGLAVTKGELRALAEQGKLTTDVVLRALQSQSAALQQEFGSLPATVGRAIENLSTKWKLFIGDLNAGTGATATVASGINALADNLEELAAIATRAGAVLVAALAVQGAGALRSLAVQMAATAGSAALLSKSLNEIPKVINIAVAVVGFEVAYQVGKVLHENTELARKLGVSVVAWAVATGESLRLVGDAVAAIFTGDTIDAAFKRFEKRIAEQRVIFQGLYDDAEKSPAAVRQAAEAAAAQTEKLAKVATDAGDKVEEAGNKGAAGLAATTVAADTAGGALRGLVTAAADANKALGQVGDDAALQATKLVNLALAGSRAAQTFSAELPAAIAKLSGPELEQFRVAMTQRLAEARTEAQRLGEQLQAAGKDGSKAFAQSEQAARLLAQVAVEVGTRAAQALGVDLAAAGGRVSKEFAQAEQNLSLLIRSMPALQASGVDAAGAVAKAISGMIQGAKSQAEIDLITARLVAMGKTGQQSGGQVAAGLEEARLKAQQLKTAIEDATPGIQSTGEAARRMGIQTREALQQTADDFAKAWARIKDSSEFTLAEKIKAFARYRDAAIAANGGVESSEVALQRQILQTKAEVAGLGAEFERSMSKAATATTPAIAAVNRLREALEGAYKAQRALDAYGPGANGGNGLVGIDDRAKGAEEDAKSRAREANEKAQRGGIVGTYDVGALGSLQLKAKRGGLSASDLATVNAGLDAAEFNLASLRSVRNQASISPAAYSSIQQQIRELQRLKSLIESGQSELGGQSIGTTSPSGVAGGAGSSSPGTRYDPTNPSDLSALGTAAARTAPASAPSPTASANTTRTLRLELGPGRAVNYQASSDAEAARVESLLRTLAAEAGRAGP